MNWRNRFETSLFLKCLQKFSWAPSSTMIPIYPNLIKDIDSMYPTATIDITYQNGVILDWNTFFLWIKLPAELPLTSLEPSKQPKTSQLWSISSLHYRYRFWHVLLYTVFCAWTFAIVKRMHTTLHNYKQNITHTSIWLAANDKNMFLSLTSTWMTCRYRHCANLERGQKKWKIRSLESKVVLA